MEPTEESVQDDTNAADTVGGATSAGGIGVLFNTVWNCILGITVEPVMFSYILVESMTSALNTNLILERVSNCYMSVQ